MTKNVSLNWNVQILDVPLCYPYFPFPSLLCRSYHNMKVASFFVGYCVVSKLVALIAPKTTWINCISFVYNSWKTTSAEVWCLISLTPRNYIWNVPNVSYRHKLVYHFSGTQCTSSGYRLASISLYSTCAANTWSSVDSKKLGPQLCRGFAASIDDNWSIGIRLTITKF